MNSVFFTDLNNGWAAGATIEYSGIILRTTNGSAIRTIQSIEESYTIIVFCLLNINNGWAAGFRTEWRLDCFSEQQTMTQLLTIK